MDTPPQTNHHSCGIENYSVHPLRRSFRRIQCIEVHVIKNSYFSLGYRKALLACALPALCSLFLAVIFAGLPTADAQSPKELHIAAASDLQPVMPTLAAEYEKATGVKIIASFGSSATLAQQITNGDPQDVFLSADYVHPEQLVAANLTTSHVPVPYAHGVLVLWARKDSPAQPITLDSLTLRTGLLPIRRLPAFTSPIKLPASWSSPKISHRPPSSLSPATPNSASSRRPSRVRRTSGKSAPTFSSLRIVTPRFASAVSS
jgi:hypothetical protein